MINILVSFRNKALYRKHLLVNSKNEGMTYRKAFLSQIVLRSAVFSTFSLLSSLTLIFGAKVVDSNPLIIRLPSETMLPMNESIDLPSKLIRKKIYRMC
jgi:uncharacterized membrane protein